VSAHAREAAAVAIRTAFGERQRPLLFALAVLIHVGLFQLLVSERHAVPETPERRTVLVLLQGTEKSPEKSPEKSRSVPDRVAPIAPQRLPESKAPQLIAPPEREETRARPSIDWSREAEETAREHALRAEAQRDHKDDSSPAKPKPEFGWSHSQIHRIEPLEEGGFLVWLNDRCAIVISVMAMPVCKFDKKPARGDLFEHMDDAPAPGDWKDE
jgi:hypothetical protein